MSEVMLVIRVKHGSIRARLTLVTMLLKETLVTTVQQVQLWVVQQWIGLFVPVPV
jgi:hypothetical protein